MSQATQFGFDFGDTSPVLRAMPEGTWLDHGYTKAQFAERFAHATAFLDRLQGTERTVLALSLDGALASHNDLLTWRAKGADADTVYPMHGHADCEDDLVIAFISHCKKMAASVVPGAEYKVRENAFETSVGVYYEGIGSIVAHWWKRQDNLTVRSSFGRSTFFLDSYRDSFDRIYCDQLVWEPAYAAQVIAESGEKIASVQTFTIGARQYVNKGALWGNAYAHCDAFSVIPAAEWQGDTFTYKSLCAAWDKGTKERGDSRGMLVRVRGQLCVLEEYVLVYDDRPRTAPIGISLSDEDDEDDQDCDGDDICAEDELERELELV